MRIERLRLVIEETEAAGWCVRFLKGREDIADPALSLVPGLLVFEGKVRIPLVGLAPFRTEWGASVDEGGTVAVRLERAAAFGWSGGSDFLTGLIMDQVAAGLAGRPGIRVEGTRVLLDPVLLAAGLPLDVRVRVTAVSVEAGRLVLEAG